jgi:hypothetical protein
LPAQAGDNSRHDILAADGNYNHLKRFGLTIIPPDSNGRLV